MRLEQTIRSTMTEAMDMDGRLDQLVRAGLMPTSSLPLLKRAISRMHAGMSLQGAERDVMNMFISSMMFIVLGDDTVFNKARAGAKGYAAEEVELDENAPIVAHLQKRYGDNIRKSHVRSAANDFGVDASKLAKAVRTKLGKNMLDEEDDGWYTHSQMHGSKKSEKHPKGISADEWKSGIRWHHGKNKRINIKEAKEKTEYDYEGDMAMGQLKSIIANSQRMHDMLSDDTNLPEWVQSKITLAEDYITTASNYMQGEMNEEKMPFEGPYRKVGERKDKYGNPVKNVAKHLAKKAMNAQTQKNEEVEQIDEILPVVAGAAARYVAGKAGAGSVGRTVAGAATKYAVSKSMNKEEVEVIDELSTEKLLAYRKKAREADTNKHHVYADEADKKIKKKTGVYNPNLLQRAKAKLRNEEVEQVDEISSDMAHRYLKGKRERDYNTSADGTTHTLKKPTTLNRLNRDIKGTVRALRTIEKSKKTNEEVEQVDEISKATMGRYINKAKDSIDMTSYRSGIKDGTAISSSTPYKSNNPLEKKLTKRHKGISMAVKKLTKEDIDAVKKMNESYKTAFETALNEYGIKSPSELDESKRKEFFNHVDLEFKKGDN